MVDLGTQYNARAELCTVGNGGETCRKGEMCLALKKTLQRDARTPTSEDYIFVCLKT